METREQTTSQISRDVIQLRESMDILHDLIQEQQESVDTLEQFIHDSKEQSKQGTEELSSISYSNSIMYALGGFATLIVYLIL